ncbi:MAG: type II secretion system F family protein [Opitutae bacterium]|jgi:type II secretory pathway component PulF|nr:type II secretion system F family protein [Opitutae bacterium]MDA8824072.1 type II secretion system F family protein [Opitutales bacterium]
MARFSYVAIDLRGKTAPGEIVANDIKEARLKIKQNGLTPIKVKASGDGGKSKTKTKKNVSLQNKLRGGKKRSLGGKGEKIGLEFLKRLLELHSSGMPIADAVKLLNQRLSDPGQKEIAGVLWKELAEGKTLSRSMRNLPQYFSESSSFVIEAGEATGNVSPILKKVISHLEEKREIRSKVLGSMAYPVFVGLIAFGVVLFFLFFLLPQIEEMLASLGGELNLMAKVLINGSNWVLAVGPFFLLALLIASASVLQWSKTEKGGMAFDQSLLKLPLFGNIFYLSEMFQLASLLSTLIWSGIGLTENLRLCEKTIKNRYIRNKFRSARALVNEGKSLPEALRKFRLMPLMQLDILEVGERTGNLGNSMEDSSKAFRLQLTKKIKTMTTLVSGGALGFAFSLVALVAISIVSSIFQVSKSISY